MLCAFLFQEICEVGKTIGIKPVIIQGDDLEKQGFGGIICSKLP